MSEAEQQDFSDIIETLEQLEQGLIEYEETLDDENSDDSNIHILFRYAHNLKSSLGMARKEHSSNLIHSVENNFDLVRSGKMSITREIIDKALEAVDLIKANLFREEETEIELAQLKEELDSIKEGPREKRKAVINFVLTSDQKSAVADEVSSGKSLFLVEKLIKTDIDREGYENLPIYEDIKAIGKLIAVHPGFENIDRSGEEGVVKILFSTSMTEDELYYEIFDPMHKIEFDLDLHVTAAVETGGASQAEKVEEEAAPAGSLQILIVEDDFTTRHLEMKILEQYGSCEVAVNGNEAVSAFEVSFLEQQPYDCVFLDIMLPEFDGHQVLKRIRDFEAEQGVYGLERTKIIIVSSLRDMENISKSFRGQSDSYIVKPVTKKKIEGELRRLKLI